MITKIQEGSTNTKDVISQIVLINSNINTLSANIKESIANHVSLTNDISNNLIQASEGSNEIFNAISEVALLYNNDSSKENVE